jgi:hypothetical protein
MLPIRVSGSTWGLVELYEMRLRRFGDEEIAVAQFLVAQAERRLETVARDDDGGRRPRVYELPSGSGSGSGSGSSPGSDSPSRPRTR